MHIKKETNEWYPQSHVDVTSLNSLILTVKFPLGSGSIAAAIAALTKIILAQFLVWSHSSPVQLLL